MTHEEIKKVIDTLKNADADVKKSADDYGCKQHERYPYMYGAMTTVIKSAVEKLEQIINNQNLEK